MRENGSVPLYPGGVEKKPGETPESLEWIELSCHHWLTHVPIKCRNVLPETDGFCLGREQCRVRGARLAGQQVALHGL